MSSSEHVSIQLTYEELMIVVASLNEVCNGIDIFEFETRIGATEEDARKLLATLIKIYRTTCLSG